MSDQLIAQRVLVRDMPDRSRISATLEIHQLAGNAHPHFSATASVWEAHASHSGASRARRGLEEDAGGCLHGALLDAFPGAVAFVRMHLADYPSGAPMHAEANAFYFLSGRAEAYELAQYGAAYTMRAGSRITRCLRALRLEDDPHALPHELERVAAAGELGDDHRPAFVAFVDAQRDRWAREARAARELLELMPDLYALRGYDGAGKACDRVPLPAWLIGADPETVNV